MAPAGGHGTGSPGQILAVVLWMTGALFAFCAMAVSVRALAGTLSVMEILAVRSAIGLSVMLGLAALRPDLRATVATRRWPLHIVRNSVHLGGSYLWAMSLLLLPLATVFALEFTSPMWTLLLGVPFLGERLTPSRIGAVVLGLAGVLVILRPGFEAFDPAMLLILAAAVALAVSLIATKMLTRTETGFAIILWMNAVQLPLALMASDPQFVTRLDPVQAPAIAAIGLSGLASHYCLARAFQAGDAGVVVPLDFLRVPLIAMVGWWLYGERIDLLVLLGAGLIIAGILWNLRSEARRSSQP
jgi:drug/metabolite transporter (DMT)-like permease